MSRELLLRNCLLYDPLNRINGEVVDIAISNGSVVESVSQSAEVIDLKRRIVMPGGVDIHSHILGSKVNMARAISPEDHRHDTVSRTITTRSGVGHVVPSSFIIGYRYSIMGYTTVIEPAVPPVKALDCWEELADLPNLDIGMLPMLSNSVIAFEYIQNEDVCGLAGYIAWVLRATGGLGVKAVNPGGTYAWAYGRNVRDIDTPIPDWQITPRQITRMLCEAVKMLRLPHPLHLHPNCLGQVGNVDTTIAQLDFMRDLVGDSGHPEVVHLAHLSFDSLGMTDGGVPEWKYVASGGSRLAKHASENRHYTVDMGQITFGPAMTMTGDGPFQFGLYQLTRSKWINATVDAELPGGAGVVPYFYDIKSPANSVQWTIALEYALLTDDVWRCVLSTDSPNAGSFVNYPLVISWLMSRRQRAVWLDRVHPLARERSLLPDIDREWDLYEVAISTRAAPAKILGIQDWKGHLGPGADADVAVYDIVTDPVDLSSDPDRVVKLFSSTHMTILRGEIVSKHGVVTQSSHGRVWSAWPVLSDELWSRTHSELKSKFAHWYAHSFENYPVPDCYRAPYEHRITTKAVDIPA